MCGIVGVLGYYEVVFILVEVFKCFEYCGYDSVGIVIVKDGVLDCC